MATPFLFSNGYGSKLHRCPIEWHVDIVILGFLRPNLGHVWATVRTSVPSSMLTSRFVYCFLKRSMGLEGLTSYGTSGALEPLVCPKWLESRYQSMRQFGVHWPFDQGDRFLTCSNMRALSKSVGDSTFHLFCKKYALFKTLVDCDIVILSKFLQQFEYHHKLWESNHQVQWNDSSQHFVVGVVDPLLFISWAGWCCQVSFINWFTLGFCRRLEDPIISLVGGLEHDYFFHNIWKNHPNWHSYFSEG